MRRFRTWAALLMAVLLLAGTAVPASAKVMPGVRFEEETEAPEEAEFTEDADDAETEEEDGLELLVTLRGKNMVSDGTYIYFVPDEMWYDYTDYFGVYPDLYEDEDDMPEPQSLRRVELPLDGHPVDVQEVLYESPCAWLSFGDDGALYFCDLEEYAVMRLDPETNEVETFYESPYGYPISAPCFRDGYLFFIEAGDLMRWDGEEEEAEVYFSAWDYSTVEEEGEEGYSWLWEVSDYAFAGDVLYVNLWNTNDDYEDVYRLIAGPVNYDTDDAEEETPEETEEEEGRKGVFGRNEKKGDEEEPEAEPEEEEEEEESGMTRDEYLEKVGFRVVSVQNGEYIAVYQDELIFVDQIDTDDEEEPYLRDDYGDYLYVISAVDAEGNIRVIGKPYDTRAMFVAGGKAYYDGYVEDWLPDEDSEEKLTGRYIFASDLEAEEPESELFSDIDNPRHIKGVAGGWLWYEYDSDNYWILLEDVDTAYWLSWYDDEAYDDEDADDEDEEDEEDEWIPPTDIPGDTGVYGPGECDLRLESEDLMAAFRLLRTDGTEQFFVVIQPNTTEIVTFPCGTYILKTAEGEEWISDEEAFGKDGIYSTTDWYVFEADYEYYIEAGERGDFEGDSQEGFLK